MQGEKRHSYRFKEFRLEVEERRLLHHDEPVPLTPKAFDVLVALVERSSHLVEKDELMRLVWSDSHVEEANVARIVHTLRKTLGEDGNTNKYIETVAKKGYRFVAEVQFLEAADEAIDKEHENHLAPQQNPSKFPHRAKPIEATISGNVVALADWRHADDENAEPAFRSKTAGQIAAFDSAAENPAGDDAEVKTRNDEIPHITKRKRGLRRGLKFFLCGIAVGFFFLILMRILQICGILLLQEKNGLLSNVSQELATLTVNLLILIEIPVGLGLFVGIGLILFGLFRIFTALFENEGSRINPALIERLLTALVIFLVLSIAIPNLISSYRKAQLAKQPGQISSDGVKSP